MAATTVRTAVIPGGANADAGFLRFLAGVLSQEDLEAVSLHSARTTTPLVDVLVAHGLMSEARAYTAMAEWTGRPLVDLEANPATATAARLLPERVARTHNIVALAEDNRTLTYASAVPFRDDVDRDVSFASGRRAQMVIATRSQIALALNQAYRQGTDIDSLVDKIRHASAVKPLERRITVAPGESPIVDLCNKILGAAISAGASDIHLEPSKDGATVRHRVCGILEPLLVLPPSSVSQVTNRFKVMANCDIATKLKPQDGAFRVSIDDDTIDVRMSALPTIHGEKLVMRVIHGSSTIQTLDTLGYDPKSTELLRSALAKPDGLVLVTGPTGCGKSTVLYAALHHLKTGRVNIVTVEDPVERQVEGVTQIAVNSKAGTAFANVIRSVMRQDPNIIMVGEIRDNEVADIVGQAAYTGHLVLSSLHTIDAASAITRLLNLGLPPFKVAESLNAVVAQRLLRKLCPHCRIVNDAPTAQRLGALNGIGAIGASLGVGCPRCKHSGYLDRIAVAEVLVPDEALRSAIRDGAGVSEIRAAMLKAGCRSMRESALDLVAQGVTSIEEVKRVLTNHHEEATAPAVPVVEAAQSAGDPGVPAVVQAVPRKKSGGRVLVTDDDRMIRMLVRMLLEKDGFEVLEAENGAVGVDLARRERPDLMLIDLQMPDMDGFEAIERIRRDISLATMPVIVLTSESGSGVETRVLEMGADDYLVKPFEPDVLISRVRAAFRRAARMAA
jgi:type IV pilus assembly protein PilB